MAWEVGWEVGICCCCGGGGGEGDGDDSRYRTCGPEFAVKSVGRPMFTLIGSRIVVRWWEAVEGCGAGATDAAAAAVEWNFRW